MQGGSGGHPIFVLYGIAGIGKSTVSKTVAEQAAGVHALGASFFFSRNEDDRKTARLFFPTIAYHLARHDAGFAHCISEALEEDPDAPGGGVRKQFDCLIAKPLMPLAGRGKPVLIVVDALDECEEQDAETILMLLAQDFPKLPRFKIFITTRPERHIRNALDRYRDHERFHLHDIEDSVVEADIRLYLDFRLSAEEVQKAFDSPRSPPWQPTNEQKDRLVRMSGKFFVVASTMASFILDPRQLAPGRRLAVLLGSVSSTNVRESEPTRCMDQIYMQIVQAARPDPVDDWVNRFQTLVGTITLLLDPLPCETLAGLLDMSADDVRWTLSNLHSLLAPVGENQIFRVHHKTFLDFISDRDRCKEGPEFFIDPTTHHLRIVKCCFQVMDRDLKPLSQRYKGQTRPYDHSPFCVPPHLAYSCTYWASHLAAGVNSDAELDSEVKSLLERFAFRQLVTWFEALSIIGRTEAAYSNLRLACETLERRYSKSRSRAAQILPKCLKRAASQLPIDVTHEIPGMRGDLFSRTPRYFGHRRCTLSTLHLP